jgi:SAM-dependent methyltransferase
LGFPTGIYIGKLSPSSMSDTSTIDDQYLNIMKDLKAEGFKVLPLRVNEYDYNKYLEQANYGQYQYSSEYFTEKTLEHHLAAKLLSLKPSDVYIDIANAGSPTPTVYHNLYGCKTYRQDLIFPQGFHADTIGGDAASMPVPDDFASAMALHCSFEHFEKDSDIGFVKELDRVLRPGGRCCIIPLYLSEVYAILTDSKAHPDFVSSDKEARIYDVAGWGQRHGRHYNAAHLKKRIAANLGNLDMTIYYVENLLPGCYVKFIAFIRKP